MIIDERIFKVKVKKSAKILPDKNKESAERIIQRIAEHFPTENDDEIF